MELIRQIAERLYGKLPDSGNPFNRQPYIPEYQCHVCNDFGRVHGYDEGGNVDFANTIPCPHCNGKYRNNLDA